VIFFFPNRHGYHSSSNSASSKDLKLHSGIQFQHSSDPVVIHPGAVLAMIDLLPSVSSDTQPEVRVSCRLRLCLKS